MANYRGHVSGAIVFFVFFFGAVAYIFSIDGAYQQFTTLELVTYTLGLFTICLLFGLWPDVDTNSRGQTIFYSLFFLVDVVLIATQRFEAAAYLGLFALLPVLGKHRGWTHSWWAVFTIPAPLLLLPFFFFPERPLAGLPFYGAAVTGYISHLFMDGMIIKFKRRKRRKSSAKPKRA